MLKNLFLLVLGVAIGYFLGFGDAKKNDRNVVERLVERTGGKARENVKNDLDAKMKDVER
jgi:hypothetical protein